jgi:hypothetical protein
MFARTLYGLPFIQLGHFYRVRLEKYDRPSYWSFTLLFLTQVFLLGKYGDLAVSVIDGDFGGQIFLPYLSGITGIWFWLQTATILSEKVNGNILIKKIGDGSLDVMVSQFFGFFLLNCVYALIHAPGFDYARFQTYFWYMYFPLSAEVSTCLYFLYGLLVPLYMSEGLQRIARALDSLTRRQLVLSTRWVNAINMLIQSAERT